MRRKLSQGIAVAAVAVTIVGGVAGCGVINKLDAKQKVSKAFNSFQDADSATFTLKLDTTKNDIQAIDKANSDSGDELDSSDLQVLDKILAGDVQYAVHAPDGKKLSDSANQTKSLSDFNSVLADPEKLANYLKTAGDFAFAVHLSGSSLVELRFRDGVLYAKADVPKIADLAGADTSEIDSTLAGLPTSLAPLKAAAKGRWISLDIPKLVDDLKSTGLLDDYKKGFAEAQGGTTPTVNASAVQKLINDLKAAYSSKVTIKEIGSSSRGDQYQLTANAKELAQSIQQDLIDLAGPDSESDIKDSISQIKNQPYNLNVWVKDDKLTGVSLDLTQFLDNKPANAKLALDVAVQENSGDIAAPSGATPIDVKALINDVQSGAFDDSGSGFSGSGFDDSSSFDDSTIS